MRTLSAEPGCRPVGGNDHLPQFTRAYAGAHELDRVSYELSISEARDGGIAVGYPLY